MRVQRGEVWLANLDPTKGSEQAGTSLKRQDLEYGVKHSEVKIPAQSSML